MVTVIGASGERERAAEDGGLEHRVAVQQHRVRAPQQLACDEATPDIVGDREERIEERPRPIRDPPHAPQGRFHLFGAEARHHRDVRDAVRGQGPQLPFEHRPSGDAQQAFRQEFGQRKQTPALAGAQNNCAQSLISFPE